MSGRRHSQPLPSDDAHKPPSQRQTTGWPLLGAGILLIMLPVVVAIVSPITFQTAESFLRIIAALGGGLIGGFIPGALQIALPGVKGAGALGIFALIYSVNPPGLIGGIAQQERVADAKTELKIDRDTNFNGTFDDRKADLQRIKGLTSAEILQLAKVMEPNPSGRSPALQRLINTFDPAKRRLTDPDVARQVLEMWAAEDEPSQENIAQWSKALLGL